MALRQPSAWRGGSRGATAGTDRTGFGPIAEVPRAGLKPDAPGGDFWTVSTAREDEFTRECLAIDVAKRLTSDDVLKRLSDLFVHRGEPEYIRSDNGSEFTAKCVREWLGRVGVKTLFIEPGSPWENGYVESFFRLAPRRAA